MWEVRQEKSGMNASNSKSAFNRIVTQLSLSTIITRCPIDSDSAECLKANDAISQSARIHARSRFASAPEFSIFSSAVLSREAEVRNARF
jgi:hypothetical protein